MLRSFRIHIRTRTPCKAALIQSGLSCPQYSRYRQPECVFWWCWPSMYVEGTSPGASTRSLQAATISVETRIWGISFRWPKTWVYWSSFGLDPTYVQSGTWWVGLWTQLIQLLKSVFRVQSTAISEVFQNNNLATDTLIYFMNPQTFKIFSNILVINKVDLLCVFVLLTRVGCLPGSSTRKTLCCGLLIQVRIQDKQAEWWHKVPVAVHIAL